MSEDPTPLAQRLVEAAQMAEPLPIAQSGRTWSGSLGELARTNSRRRAESAVVAVLRELADDLDEAGGHHQGLSYINFADLRRLADSIEKGEG